MLSEKNYLFWSDLQQQAIVSSTIKENKNLSNHKSTQYTCQGMKKKIIYFSFKRDLNFFTVRWITTGTFSVYTILKDKFT
jgi:hypothetical protein